MHRLTKEKIKDVVYLRTVDSCAIVMFILIFVLFGILILGSYPKQ